MENEEKQNEQILSEVTVDSNAQVKEEPVATGVMPDAVRPVVTQQKTKVLKEKRPLLDKFALTFIILGVIAMAVGFVPLVSGFFLAIYYVLLMCAVVLTLFTLLLNEEFRGWLSGGQQVGNVIGEALPYCVYIFSGAIGMFALSLILYCFSKKKSRRVAGIVLSILFTIFSVAGLILARSIH